MTTQSIIIYRSPYEAAFYESGLIVPLCGGLLAFFLVVLSLSWAVERLARRRMNNQRMWTIFALAGFAGVGTFRYLVI
jgi:flagellar biogenesis protein FliO